MSFGTARRAGGAVKASLARTLWRSLASLPSPDQVERLISREVARAERNGLHFSLVLFRVRRGGRLKLNERRLALTLLRRVRLTDEVGWFNEDHLCALLPDTSSEGARIFADSVCAQIARKGPRPLSSLYSYPFNWIGSNDDDDNSRGPDRSGQPTGSRSTDARHGDSRGGRHAPVSQDAIHSNRLGLSDIVGEDAPAPGNDDCRLNTLTYTPGPADSGTLLRTGGVSSRLNLRDEGGPVAVLEEPRVSFARPQMQPADRPDWSASTGPAEVKHLHQLLVRRMPFWKRVLDITGAAIALSIFSPMLIAAAVAIKLSSPGPVIFKQRRAGLGGRAFTIFKFRTMCIDAEAKKRALRQHSEQDGPAFKMTRDPRVTRIGQLLRKTSIDELPQLFNVLKGDMSLVGPRPLPLDEQSAAETWQQRRLDVTPGLTCIWQITGRSQVTFSEWVRMDVKYMRRRTVLHDLSILFKTVPAVLLRRGAK